MDNVIFVSGLQGYFLPIPTGGIPYQVIRAWNVILLLLSDTKRLPVPSPARSVTAASGLRMHPALLVTPLASRAQSLLPNSNQNKYNLNFKKKIVELFYFALFFNMQLDNMKCIKVKQIIQMKCSKIGNGSIGSLQQISLFFLICCETDLDCQ